MLNHHHQMASIRPKAWCCVQGVTTSPSCCPKQISHLLLGDDMASINLHTLSAREHSEHSLLALGCVCVSVYMCLVICEGQQPAQTPLNCPNDAGGLAELDQNQIHDSTESEHRTSGAQNHLSHQAIFNANCYS